MTAAIIDTETTGLDEPQPIEGAARQMIMTKPTRCHRALIHAIADCVICGKHWEDYLTVQKLAYAHARKTGHKVIVDLGYVCEYGGAK